MSEINRHSAGSKQAGVSMGGKFAATEKTEASGAGLAAPVQTYTTKTDVMEQAILPALGEHAQDFDVDQIFDEAFEFTNGALTQSCSDEEFWEIAARHDRTAQTEPALPQLSPSQLEKLNDGEDVDTNAWGEEDAEASVFNVVRAHVEAKSKWERELTYIDASDQLNSDQIDAYLADDTDDLTEIEEQYYESTCDASERMAKEILEELGVEDADTVDDDLIRELGEIVREHDESDIISDLARNTPPQLMRAPVSQEDFGDPDELRRWMASDENLYGYTRDELYNGSDERSADAREAYLTGYLRRAGVSVDAFTVEDKENIRTLATDGPYYWHEGVRLDVIWHGDIRDASATEEGRTIRLGGAPEHTRENPAGRTHLVLLDSVNGAGMDASISTPVTVTLTQDRGAHLDSGGTAYGYGWDDTAGVVKSAYGVGVADMSRAGYDRESYEQHPDGELTERGKLQARHDIDAELSQHRADLRRRDEDARRRGPDEDLPDAQVAEWNAVHDRVSLLESARFETFRPGSARNNPA
ncbi:hypothetical protein ACXR2T_10000 [Leucobacter sp. HY1910]